MTPELAYFLKINVAIALFYAFYRLFFHKDTFFHWRRMALLCFFAKDQKISTDDLKDIIELIEKGKEN